MQTTLKVFETVAYWNPDFKAIGKSVVGEYGPDIIAKDRKAVQQLICIMRYQVVEVLQKVGEVDASDIVGTPLLPAYFDPNQN